MHNNTLSLSSIRNDVGTTTAEYAVCTGAATGFGCLLYAGSGAPAWVGR